MGITDVGGYLELLTQIRSEETGPPGNTDDAQELYLQQAVQIATEGYVYHPNLFEFALAGLFGITERYFEQTIGGRSDENDKIKPVLGYDFRSTLFREKQYPMTLYARRNQRLVSRLFRSSLENTTNSYGALWSIVGKDVRSTLLFNHQKVELDALDDDDLDQETRDTTVRADLTFDLTESSQLHFDYEYRKRFDDLARLDYHYNQINLDHIQRFGSLNEHRLESHLEVFDQRGSLPQEEFRWRENLFLQITEDLTSGFEFEYRDLLQGNRFGLEPLESTSYEADAYIRHLLYESLATRLRGYERYTEFEPSGSREQWGIELTSDYRKTTPWGLLSLSYAGSFRRDDRDRPTPLVLEVIDEAQTFNDPFPVTLAEENVVQPTIFVTAVDGVTIYQEGLDYFISTVGNQTQLDRIPGGTIVNGETVLIDYLYETGDQVTIDTWNQAFSFRHAFDFGLEIYYSYFWQDQSADQEAGPEVFTEDIDDYIVGAEYTWEWLRLRAEYEDRDSNLNSWEALRLGALLRKDWDWGGRTSLGVTWTRRDESQPRDRNSTLFRVLGRYRHRLAQDFNLEAQVGFRRGTDSITGNDTGWDAEMGLQWLFKKVEVRMNARYLDYEGKFSEEQDWLFYLQVRRLF